jgi:hypothetical protein
MFGLSEGTMLLYVGIGGMGLTFIIGVITSITLGGSRKKLKNKLDEEYGRKA